LECLTGIAMREMISCHVDYTRQISGGEVDIKMCYEKGQGAKQMHDKLVFACTFINCNNQVGVVTLEVDVLPR